MHVTNDGKHRSFTAHLSGPIGPAGQACMRANRVSDIMQYGLAALSLGLLAPLFLVIGLCIKVTSRGPILYRGLRVGKDGRIFTILKFRTLEMGAEQEIGARLLTEHDVYYTSIGKFLKRTKLDELPQLINVLKGEMNLVGPRPIRPIFLEKLCDEIPHYPIRFAVKPGMTGLAQVRGGYFTEPKDKLRYEILYLKKRSLLLDVKLIALTIASIPKEFFSGPFSSKRPSQPRSSLPNPPGSSDAIEHQQRDTPTIHTPGQMRFAISQIPLSVERSHQTRSELWLFRQALIGVEPLSRV